MKRRDLESIVQKLRDVRHRAWRERDRTDPTELDHGHWQRVGHAANVAVLELVARWGDL